jgi:hypothetical protein
LLLLLLLVRMAVVVVERNTWPTIGRKTPESLLKGFLKGGKDGGGGTRASMVKLAARAKPFLVINRFTASDGVCGGAHQTEWQAPPPRNPQQQQRW